MANYHFNTSYGNVSKTSAHASYILGEGKYSYKENEIMFANSKLPSWAENENVFWEAVETYERANGRGYREFRFSLPNELSIEENICLVNDFIKDTLKDKFYYTVAIHNKEVNDFEKVTQNIHCHLMFNERKIDGIERTAEQFFKRANTKEPIKGGTKKSTEFNPKEKLLELRKDMEVLVNSYYEKNGFEERVTCESLEKQKEIAEENSDLHKVEFLDRDPINIEGYLLKKPIEKMNEDERTKYDLFILNKEIRDIKLDIYNSKLQKENIEEPIKFQKEINEESIVDEYISNEKNIIEIENEILKTNRFIEEIELRTLFALDKESYNVYRNKELLEKELFVMDNYESKNEIYYENRAKLEEKIFNYDTALEISINELKEKRNEEFFSTKKNLLKESKERISTLEINKANFLNLNTNIAEQSKNFNYSLQKKSFEDSFEYNFKSYLSTKKELFKIDSEISKVENQIETKLKEITLNKMTDGKYSKFENQKRIYDNKIKRCDRILLENSAKDPNFIKRERNIYIERIEKINLESKNIYKPLDKNKYYQLKSSIEIKLKEKMINLKSEKDTLNGIVSIQKSNFIQSDITKDNLNNFINKKDDEIYKLDYQINHISSQKKYLQEYYSNNRINDLAFTKIFKGENINLRNQFEEIEKNIDVAYLKLNNSNFFEKISLKKEIKSLENSLSLVKEEYSNMYKNVDMNVFRSTVNTILESKEKALNGLEKIETNISLNLKDAKSELFTLKELKRELYPYQGLETKVEKINFNKLIDHAQTGGGGQEKIESFFDELEKENRKAKSRDFER